MRLYYYSDDSQDEDTNIAKSFKDRALDIQRSLDMDPRKASIKDLYKSNVEQRKIKARNKKAFDDNYKYMVRDRLSDTYANAGINPNGKIAKSMINITSNLAHLANKSGNRVADIKLKRGIK